MTTAKGRPGTSRMSSGTSPATTSSEGRRRRRRRPMRWRSSSPSGARCSTACVTTRTRSLTASTGSRNCASSGATENATDLAHSDARLRAIDLQYHDLRPERSLAQRVGLRALHVRTPKFVKPFTIRQRRTRAYFRGQCVARYPDEIVAANWDSVVFDLGEGPLQRVPNAGSDEGYAHTHRRVARNECDGTSASRSTRQVEHTYEGTRANPTTTH